MNAPVICVTLLLVTVATTSCSSHTRRAARNEGIEVTVLPAHSPNGTDALPARPAHATRGQPTAPHRYTLDEAPLPLYRDAEVMEIEMEAYLNEKGELVAPGKKWVVTKPGGWNMDAARSPERAYIPAENIAPLASANGYTAMVFPGKEIIGSVDDRRAGNQPARGVIELVKKESVRVLGFFSKNEEQRARSLLVAGEVLVFDQQLGYLAVPATIMASTPVAVDVRAGATGTTPQAAQLQAKPRPGQEDSDAK